MENSIKIKENILSKGLLYMCYYSLEKLRKEQAWASSVFSEWSFSQGSIQYCSIPDKLISALSTHLNKYISDDLDFTDAEFQFRVYEPGSSILLHKNFKYKTSLTIYLVDEWNPDWGGLFMYSNEEDSYLKQQFSSITPFENKMIVYDNSLFHGVSTVNYFSEKPRRTIQINLGKLTHKERKALQNPNKRHVQDLSFKNTQSDMRGKNCGI